MRSWAVWILALLGAALAGGCAESDSALPIRSDVASTAMKSLIPAMRELGPGEKNGKGHGQGRGGRMKNTPVYVDGKLVGALRFRELPPELPVSWHPLDEGFYARRFAFVDYLAAIDVPLDKLRALHLHGGRRVSVIEGDEVRRAGKAIQFQFTRGTAGNPTYKHDGPIATNTSIDKIRAVAVYVEREAPTVKSGALFLDGKPVEGIAYVDDPRAGGTRVYLDGRLLDQIKRREIDAVAQDAGGKAVLSGLIRSFGIDPSSVHTAELVARDHLAAVMDAATLAGDARALAVAPKSRGRLSVEGVADGAPIDAVILYAKATPIDRTGPSPRTGHNDHCGERCDERHAARKHETQNKTTRPSVPGLTGGAKDIGG